MENLVLESKTEASLGIQFSIDNYDFQTSNEVHFHFSHKLRYKTGELQGNLEIISFKISSHFMT